MKLDAGLTRRSFLRGLGGVLAYSMVDGLPSQAQASPFARGCVLRPGQASELHAAALNASFSGFTPATGNLSLDRSIGSALTKICVKFDVYPGFGFINDSGNPNAYADPETKVPGTWGTVYIGKTLLNDQLNAAPSGVSVLGVIAHEFGHILQFKTGYSQRLDGPTVRLIELQADYLAGYFVGSRAALPGDRLDTDALGDAFEAIGDWQVNDRSHHGTPKERVNALTAGFRLGKDTQSGPWEALQQGERTVRSI